MRATGKTREKSNDNIWQSPRKLQCVSSVGWISVDLKVKFWFCSFVSHLRKRGEFHICHNSQFYCSAARKSCLEVKIAVAKRDARNWGLNNIPWTITISKEEFFKCSDIAAVYSTPVNFTRHRICSKVSRIRETLVNYTTTRKKPSTVMKPIVLMPNSKLNRWPGWN